LGFTSVLTDHSESGEKSSHMYGCDKLLQQRVTKTRLQAVMAKKWAIFTRHSRWRFQAGRVLIRL
jgi:hypothetical protein